MYLQHALRTVDRTVYFEGNNGWRDQCLKKINDLIDKTLKAKDLSEAGRTILEEIVEERRVPEVAVPLVLEAPAPLVPMGQPMGVPM